MDAIDLLENRISALELAVLPGAKSLDENDPPVTDLLSQAHSMIVAALSCREVITHILKRMETINDYLNPDFCDNQLDLQDKKTYVLETYPHLKKTIEIITEFNELKAYLDSPAINDIPKLVEQIEKLTISNSDMYTDCKEATDNVLLTLQRYNSLTTSIKVIFAQMEQAIASLELSLQQKAKIDE